MRPEIVIDGRGGQATVDRDVPSETAIWDHAVSASQRSMEADCWGFTASSVVPERVDGSSGLEWRRRQYSNFETDSALTVHIEPGAMPVRKAGRGFPSIAGGEKSLAYNYLTNAG